MATLPKKSLKDTLNPEEKQALEAIYKGFRVPTDQLRRCPDILYAIAAGFERTTSRRVEPGLLLRYMFNRRKGTDWPKLGRRAEKLPSLLDLLPPNQLAALEKVYEDLGRPVDEYQFRSRLAADLAERFFKATGVSETGEVLSAVMTARRKRGLWPAMFEDQTTQKIEKPFGDIADVHRKHKRA